MGLGVKTDAALHWKWWRVKCNDHNDVIDVKKMQGKAPILLVFCHTHIVKLHYSEHECVCCLTCLLSEYALQRLFSGSPFNVFFFFFLGFICLNVTNAWVHCFWKWAEKRTVFMSWHPTEWNWMIDYCATLRQSTVHYIMKNISRERKTECVCVSAALWDYMCLDMRVMIIVHSRLCFSCHSKELYYSSEAPWFFLFIYFY